LRSIRVLMVDDNPGDRMLTRELLMDSELQLELCEVESGEYALRFLRGEPPFQPSSGVDLVLLDLNMPGIGGKKVLQIMRADATLRHIPVAVLSTSTAQSDVLESYSNGANCYVVKPVGLTEFQKVVSVIEQFWFNVATLPPR
jgi:two-component system, chemotaxis family, response regulator Rcp1